MIESRQECRHTALWATQGNAPKPGERIYCRQCEDMRRVDSITGSYVARCVNCAWHRTRFNVVKLRDQVVKHLQDRPGHVINVENHDGTERLTARTTHAARKVGQDAESDGSHSASDAATARVLPPSRRNDTLF